MNRQAQAIGGIAIAVAVACTTIQRLALPVALGGADLSVLAGHERDAHLLTGWLWHAVTGPCAGSAPCVYGINAVAFALFVFGFTILAWQYLSRRMSSAYAVACTILSGLLLGLSPLAAGLISGPLGAETATTLALFILALADTARIIAFPVAVRSIVAIALGLQDPLLVPVALAYGPLAARRFPSDAVLPLLGALAAFGVHVITGTPVLGAMRSWHIDALAGPPTIVTIGLLLFFAAPAVLYSVHAGLREWLGMHAPFPLQTLALGALGLAAGMFCRTGDPTPYFLLGEAATLITLLSAIDAGAPGLRFAIVFAIPAMLQLLAFASYYQSLPPVALASRSLALQAMTATDAKQKHATCIAADASARAHLLVPDLFLTSPEKRELHIVGAPAQCPTNAADDLHLVVLAGWHVQDWGVSGLNLARAQSSAATATFVLPVDQGSVSPRIPARTPTGLGAFSQHAAMAASQRLEVDNFTVLAGYSYRFDCVRVKKSERLSFSVGLIPNNARSARYDISLKIGKLQYGLADGALPRSPGPDYTWHFVSAPVPASSDCAQITFSVPSPVRFGSIWVTFVGASIE